MAKSPKISLITPVYNSKDFLKSTIESVLAQTFQDFEYLIIDDGSRDGSEKICDQYAAMDKRIRVFHISNNGVSNARNIGIKNAKGEWIEFLDSDDFLEKNAMTELLAYSDNVDLVCCGYKTFPENKEYLLSSFMNNYSNLIDTIKDFEELFNKGFYNAIWNKIYKRSLIEHYFDKDISLGEDLIFNIHYLKKCNGIRYVSKSIYRYRIIKSESLSKMYRKDALELEKKIFYYMIETFQHSNLVYNVMSKSFLIHMVGQIQLMIYTDYLKSNEKKSILKNWLDDYDYKLLLSSFKSNNLEWVSIINNLLKHERFQTVLTLFIIKKYATKLKLCFEKSKKNEKKIDKS